MQLSVRSGFANRLAMPELKKIGEIFQGDKNLQIINKHAHFNCQLFAN